jgi:hypothetical protein
MSGHLSRMIASLPMSILSAAFRVYRALQTECKQSGNPPAALLSKDRYRQTRPEDFHRSRQLLEKHHAASPAKIRPPKLIMLAFLLSQVLESVGASCGKEARETVGQSTLRDWADLWSDRSKDRECSRSCKTLRACARGIR